MNTYVFLLFLAVAARQASSFSLVEGLNNQTLQECRDCLGGASSIPKLYYLGSDQTTGCRYYPMRDRITVERYLFHKEECFLPYLTYHYPAWRLNYTSAGYLFRHQYWLIDLLLENGMTTVPAGNPAANLTARELLQLPQTVNIIPVEMEESLESHYNLTGLPFYAEVKDRASREKMILPGLLLVEQPPVEVTTVTSTTSTTPSPPAEAYSPTTQAMLWVFGVLGFGGVLRVGMLLVLK